MRDALNVEGRLDAMNFARRWWPWLVAPLCLAAVLMLMRVPPIWAALIGAVVLVSSASAPLGIHYAFRMFFGFGLYTHRALLTFVGFLLVGWLGTLMANRGTIAFPALHLGPLSVAQTTVADFSSWSQVLFVDVTPVNTVVVEGTSSPRGLAPAAAIVDPGARVAPRSPAATPSIPSCMRPMSSFRSST